MLLVGISTVATSVYTLEKTFAATFYDFIYHNHQFHFINHSNVEVSYSLGSVTNGKHNEINGFVSPGKSIDTKEFYADGYILEKGDVNIISIPGVPSPGFRFWSGLDKGNDSPSQYINLLGKNGYTVTRNTSEISEVTGNGYRITVDGGGHSQSARNIYIQIYNN